MPALDNIGTIVILMFENRSFDHVLGHLKITNAGSPVDGLVNPSGNLTYENIYQHTPYRPFILPNAQYADETALVAHDLPHERDAVHTQIADNGMLFQMNGFVEAYVTEVGDLRSFAPPMAYFDQTTAWMSNFLA